MERVLRNSHTTTKKGKRLNGSRVNEAGSLSCSSVLSLSTAPRSQARARERSPKSTLRNANGIYAPALKPTPQKSVWTPTEKNTAG